MKRESFDAGMKLLENGLQGEFLLGFVGVIETKLEDADEETWSGIVEYLLRSAKKPREMTLHDFLRAWTETRVRREQERKAEEVRKHPPSEAGSPRPFRQIVAEMAMKSGNRWIMELSQSLERRAQNPDSEVEMVRLTWPKRYKEALERVGDGEPPVPEPPGQPPPPLVESW